MVDFERLPATAERLVARTAERNPGADEVFIASRTTAGAYRYTYGRGRAVFSGAARQELTEPDLYVGFALAYSWMSTIKQPDPSLATVNAAVTGLNNAHTLQPTDLGVTGNDPATIDADSVSQLVIFIEPVRPATFWVR